MHLAIGQTLLREHQSDVGELELVDELKTSPSLDDESRYYNSSWGAEEDRNKAQLETKSASQAKSGLQQRAPHEDELADIANHLSAAQVLLTDVKQRRLLARLSLHLARSMHQRTAYVSALVHVNAALRFMLAPDVASRIQFAADSGADFDTALATAWESEVRSASQ